MHRHIPESGVRSPKSGGAATFPSTPDIDELARRRYGPRVHMCACLQIRVREGQNVYLTRVTHQWSAEEDCDDCVEWLDGGIEVLGSLYTESTYICSLSVPCVSWGSLLCAQFSLGHKCQDEDKECVCSTVLQLHVCGGVAVHPGLIGVHACSEHVCELQRPERGPHCGRRICYPQRHALHE